MKLYHAPRSRSVRIVWLLEELGLEYELETREFQPAAEAFAQKTPTGKFPVLEDNGMVMSESGAILQYILERYAEGRLQPPIGSPERGTFLQWLHFAEATAHPPLGTILWHSIYRQDVAPDSPVMVAARERARSPLQFLEDSLEGSDYILGKEFSAADIMLGFTVFAAQVVGVLDESFPNLAGYMARLQTRPALQKALSGSI